jgi:hypothetical protein
MLGLARNAGASGYMVITCGVAARFRRHGITIIGRRRVIVRRRIGTKQLATIFVCKVAAVLRA